MTDHANPFPTANPEPVVLSVIVPCRNVADHIDTLVDRTLRTFDKLKISAELVLVDDGSRDATWERIDAQRAQDVRVSGVQHENNQGIATAYLSGAAAASGQLICLIGADLQHSPEDIALLYRCYLQELPDMVQAVRGSRAEGHRLRFISRGLNGLGNYIFGMNLQDHQSRLILCRRDVFRAMMRRRGNYKYYHRLMILAAVQRSYHVQEVETNFQPRPAGTSWLSCFPFSAALRTVWEMFRFRAELRSEGTPQSPTHEVPWPMTTLVDTAGGNLERG